MGANTGGPGLIIVERMTTCDLIGSGVTNSSNGFTWTYTESQGRCCFPRAIPVEIMWMEEIPSTEQSAPKPRPYSLEKNPYQVGPLCPLIIHYTCPFSFLFPGPGYKRSNSARTEPSNVLSGSALRGCLALTGLGVCLSEVPAPVVLILGRCITSWPLAFLWGKLWASLSLSGVHGITGSI